MPNCIIMGCPHKTGNNQKFPGIVLHSFPSSIERIKKWILQTGQLFQDPDTLANKIYEGKKTDTFRMCSAHFTKDSYIFTAQKRFLKHNALPAVFPQAAEGKPLIDEQKIVGKRKKRSERVEPKNISSFICSRCLMSENLYEGKILVDAGTQTEDDLQKPQQAPVLPMSQAVLMFSVPLQSYGTQPIAPIIKQPTPALGSHSFVGYNAQDLLKNTNFHHIATTSQTLPHPLGDLGGLPLSVSSDHNKVEERWPQSEGSMSAQTQESQEGDSLISNMVRGRKLLVFEDCLDSLVSMVKCRHDSGCTKLVKRFNKEYRGSAVTIRGQCENGHFFKIWESQPRVKRFFAGNVLMAASLFCSGLRYREARDFFNTLGLRHISEKKCHYYQKYYCYPAIHAAWDEERQMVSQELQGSPVCLAGDRQYGRSGRNAEHCIYTLSDAVSEKIVDLEMIGSTPCQPVVDMEKQGLRRCLSRVIAGGLDVACFASDPSESVVESMKENYPHVDHQFNVWRYAKNISRKLRAASRSRGCANIRPWITTIHDHFLWSVQTSENNEDLLREKWLSVIHHIVNRHSWQEGSLYKQCAHGDLSHKTLRETLWLKPGSPSYHKVQEIVTDPQILQDLKHLTWNCHVVHNNVLKFRTRGSLSGIDEIEARMKLSALHHNQNVGQRETEMRVLSRRTTNDGAMRKRMANTGRSKWLVPMKREPSSYHYLWPVLEGVLGMCEGTKPTSYISKAPPIPQSDSVAERPNKAVAKPIPRLFKKKRKCECEAVISS